MSFAFVGQPKFRLQYVVNLNMSITYYMNAPSAQTKGEKRQVEIIHLAREALVKESFDAFSLREIAARANMKLGNLQYYFQTKDRLLLAVVEQEAQRDIDELNAVLLNKPDPKQQLRSFCRLIINRWHGDSGRIFSLMSFLAQQNPVFSTLYQQVYDNFYAALTPILAAIDPGRRANTYLQRAMLVTALIDGAPGQIARGSSKRFVDLIVDEALHIAGGE